MGWAFNPRGNADRKQKINVVRRRMSNDDRSINTILPFPPSSGHFCKLFQTDDYSILAYFEAEYTIPSMAKPSIYRKDHRTLAEKIKKARTDVGLNQEDAARLLGMTQPNISKIESGQRHIKHLQLKEMARVYKKDLSYFND